MSFNISKLYDGNHNVDDDDDLDCGNDSTKSDKVTLEDFAINKVVGRGAYGKVYKARFKRDG